MFKKTTKEIIEKTKCVVPLECQKGYMDYASRFLSMHTVRYDEIIGGAEDLPVLSILVTGPTGSGKSYVMSALAKAADVNLIIVDCSSLSRTGWKGTSINDILCEKLKNKKYSNTVVWFDEFDKLRFYENTIEGNAQFNFLKLYDGQITGEVDRSPVTINTRSLSFVYSGAFEGIEDIVSRRNKPEKQLGFGASSKTPLKSDETITIDDIKEYGILPELCGRIGSIYSLSPLSVKDYRTLLKGHDGSVLSKFENLFKSYGVTLNMTNTACDYLAYKSSKSEFGARSAGPIVFDLLQKTVPVLESNKEIKKITIDYNEKKGVYTKFGKSSNTKPKTIPESVAVSEPAAKPEPEKPDCDYKSEQNIQVDDINLYPYIQTGRHDEIIEKMLSLCGPAKHPGDTLITEKFLKTCIYFLDTCMAVDDMTLDKIEELAEYAEKPEKGKYSLFCKMVKDSTKKRPKSPKQELLIKSLNEYMVFEGENTGEMILSSIKNIRSRWYNNLIKMVS